MTSSLNKNSNFLQEKAVGATKQKEEKGKNQGCAEVYS
jgi:hypothetical protein